LIVMSDPILRMTVAFDDADGEGIVFFGNYFRLAHRALERWLPEVAGIGWAEWFKNPDVGVPLRHVEADYLKPLRPGDVFEARIAVASIGDSSVHFVYEFKAPDGTDTGAATFARLKTSHVFIDRHELKKTTVPASLRARLERRLVSK
jgi:acyl-CoA thioesterase FadM